MTLYEIDERISALMDPETGEIADYEAFEQLQMDRDAKLENIGLWIKDLKAEAAAIKAEIASQQERAKAAERKAERLEGYLEAVLAGNKFSTPRVSVSWRTSKAVVFEDGDEAAFCAAHPEYTVTKTEVKPDKKAITADLKAGAEIPGAYLEERLNMSIK